MLPTRSVRIRSQIQPGRERLAAWAVAGVLLAAAGCEEQEEVPEPGLSPNFVSGPVDDKSKLYNLIGRWYPASEVTRLRDETLTPLEWCAQEPVKLNVMPDSIQVRCGRGAVHSAAIARVKTSTKPGEITLLLRVSKESPMKQLRFEDVRGPTATIAGLPCWEGKPIPHQRFPEYEILTRQILGGRRCSQLEAAAAAAAGDPPQ